MSAKSKKSAKCAISMSLALELITQAADRPGVSADLAESFLRTVIAAVASRQYITADFFSPYGEAGRKMYETLKAALERSDRARAAAARRKARREEAEKRVAAGADEKSSPAAEAAEEDERSVKNDGYAQMPRSFLRASTLSAAALPHALYSATDAMGTLTSM